MKPLLEVHNTPKKSLGSPEIKPHFEGKAAPLKNAPQLVPIMNPERKQLMVQELGALSSILTSPK